MTISNAIPQHSTSHIFQHSFPVPPRKNHSDFFYFVEEIYSSLNEAPLSNDVFIEYINTLIGSGNNFVEDIKDIANAVLAKVSNATITHTFLVLYTIEIHLRQVEDQLTYKPTEDDYNNVWKAIIPSEYDAYQDSEKRQIQLTTWYMHTLFKISLQAPDSRAKQFDEETSELHFMIKLSNQRCFLSIPLDISSWLDNFTYIPDWFKELYFIDNARSSLSGPICLNKQTAIPLKNIENWDFDAVQQTADFLLNKESDYLKLLGFALFLLNYSFNPKADKFSLLFKAIPKLAQSQYILSQDLAKRVAEEILELDTTGHLFSRFKLLDLLVKSDKFINEVFLELQNENLEIKGFENDFIELLIGLMRFDKVRTLNIIAKQVNEQTELFPRFLKLATLIQVEILQDPQLTLPEQNQNFKWLIKIIAKCEKDYLNFNNLNTLLKHSKDHFPKLNSYWVLILEYVLSPNKDLLALEPHLLIEWLNSLSSDPQNIFSHFSEEARMKLKQIQDYSSLLSLEIPENYDQNKISTLLTTWNNNNSLFDQNWLYSPYVYKLTNLLCYLSKTNQSLKGLITTERFSRILTLITQHKHLVDLYLEDMTIIMKKIGLKSSERLDVIFNVYPKLCESDCNKLIFILENWFKKEEYQDFNLTDIQLENLILFLNSALDLISIAIILPKRDIWVKKLIDIIELFSSKNKDQRFTQIILPYREELKLVYDENKKNAKIYNAKTNKTYSQKTLKESLKYVLEFHSEENYEVIYQSFILWLANKENVIKEMDQEDREVIQKLMTIAVTYSLTQNTAHWDVAAQIMLNEQLANIFGIDEKYCQLAIAVLNKIPENASVDKIKMYSSFFANPKVRDVFDNCHKAHNNTLHTEFYKAKIGALRRLIMLERPIEPKDYGPLNHFLNTSSPHVKDQAILSIAEYYFEECISDVFLSKILEEGIDDIVDKKVMTKLIELKTELERQKIVIANLKNMAAVPFNTTAFFDVINWIRNNLNKNIIMYLQNHQNKRRFLRWLIQNWMILTRTEKDLNKFKNLSTLIYFVFIHTTKAEKRISLLQNHKNSVGIILYHLINGQLQMKLKSEESADPVLDLIKSCPAALKSVPGCQYEHLMAKLGAFLLAIGLVSPERTVNTLIAFETQFNQGEFRLFMDKIFNCFFKYGKYEKSQDFYVYPFLRLCAGILKMTLESQKINSAFFERMLVVYLSIDPGTRADEFTWNTTLLIELKPTFEKAKELNKIEPARLECYQFLASPLNDQYKDEKRKNYLKIAQEISTEFNGIFDQKIKELSVAFNHLETKPTYQQKAKKSNGLLHAVLLECL